MPDNRSFLDIVNGVGAPPRGAPQLAATRTWHLAASLRAFAFSRPWLVTLCVAVISLGAAVYGAAGYFHERDAAAPAARASANAPQQRDRARERPAVAAPRIETAADAQPQPAAADAAAPDRVVPLIAALGPPAPSDVRLADLPAANAAAMLRADSAILAGASFAPLWGRLAARSAEEQLDRLNLAYAELVDERDQLRERVKQLEQTLSSLQTPPASPQAARTPPDNSVGAGSARPGAAVIAFPGAAAGATAGEPSRPTVKNFTTPGSVPNYFSDESGAVLGNHAAAPHR